VPLSEYLADFCLQKGFTDYEEITDAVIREFAKNVELKREFVKKCKITARERSDNEIFEKPEFAFIKQCEKEMIPALGILNRIQNGQLNLSGYNLNQSLCNALSLACKKNPDLFHSLILESNGLKDKQMCILTTGLLQLTQLRKFSCKNNEILTETMPNIKELLLI
jgi:hypothetical protein